MSVQNEPGFKSNPWYDAIIMAGGEIDYSKQVEKAYAVKNEAREKVEEKVRFSYEARKKTLRDTPLEYSKYLKIIKKSLKQKKLQNSKYCVLVIHKLDIMAQGHIKFKEGPLSCIHKLFHRLSQLFKGQGFLTEGEQGQKLVHCIRVAQLETLKIDFRDYIKGWIDHPDAFVQKFMLNLNSLSDTQFTELMSHSFFEIESLHLSNKNKYKIYKQLNIHQRELLEDLFLKRKDGLRRLGSILNNNAYDENDISPKIVKHFQDHQKQVIREYAAKITDQPRKFFTHLLERTIKDYYDNKNFIEIGALTTDPRISREIKWLFDKPNKLRADEITDIKNNIIFFNRAEPDETSVIFLGTGEEETNNGAVDR